MAASSGGGPAPSPAGGAQYDLAYITSWPLVCQLGAELKAVERLDFEAERRTLVQVLRQAGKAVRVRTEVATSSNLRSLTTMGVRALHYSGHGLPNVLAFEDGQGAMHALDADRLRALMAAGGGAQSVRFVFVSACYSEAAGMAFVGAGVPHVIAVRSDSQVADQSSIIFTEQVYTALLNGMTVQQAFDIAVAAVHAAPHVIRSDEKKKFLLLPLNGDHNVPVFADLPDGDWRNLSASEQPNNLPAPPEQFRGRNHELQTLVSVLQKRRLLTVCGERGVGKSALAVAAARYMLQRGLFSGAYCVSLGSYVPDAEHAQAPDHSVELSPKQVEDMLAPTHVVREASAGSVRSAADGGAAAARSVAAVVSHELGIEPLRATARKLAEFLRERNLLLIFDNADEFLQRGLPQELQLHDVLRTLFAHAPQLKVVVTARASLGHVEGASEYLVRVEPLPPPDAAQLFYHAAPRRIPLAEFGCGEPERAVQALAEHEALRLLAGNPGRIRAALWLLNDHSMSELPALIRKQLRDQQLLQPEPAPKRPPPQPPAADAAGGASPRGAVPAVPPRASGALAGDAAQRLVADPAARELWTRRFPGRAYVGWADFSRFASEHFVQALKAKLERDCGCINEQVTLQAFAKFWPFFAALEACVERHLRLWLMRDPPVLQGLLSRDAAARTLQNCAPGTFLLRMSENNAGCFALAYVGDQARAHHVLIRAEPDGFTIELKGEDSRRTYSTLEDLLVKCHPLRTLFPDRPKSEIFSSASEQPA